MKIVLREHVDHLGERGDVVTVAAGYARNYLIPKRLAMTATPGNMKVLDQQRKVWAAKESRELSEAQALAARIGEIQLSVAKKSGETGTLYGAVTNVELAELLIAQGVEVDRRRILLDEPIKAVGAFDVPIRLHREVTASFKLEVVAEQERE
jgi:large subunit ribosomal protein L9